MAIKYRAECTNLVMLTMDDKVEGYPEARVRWGIKMEDKPMQAVLNKCP